MQGRPRIPLALDASASRITPAVRAVRATRRLYPGYEVPLSSTARSPDGAKRAPGPILNELQPLIFPPCPDRD